MWVCEVWVCVAASYAMAHLWFKAVNFALCLNNYEISPGGSGIGRMAGCPVSYLAPRARCAGALSRYCMCIVCRYFTTGDTRTVENSSLTSRVTPEHLLSPKSRKLPY